MDNFADVNLSDLNRDQLIEVAEQFGVMPDEGSGANGYVTVSDLVEALEPVQENLQPAPVADADPNEQYMFDTDYILLDDVNGYEEGEVIRNWPRQLGRDMLDEGKIEAV